MLCCCAIEVARARGQIQPGCGFGVAVAICEGSCLLQRHDPDGGRNPGERGKRHHGHCFRQQWRDLDLFPFSCVGKFPSPASSILTRSTLASPLRSKAYPQTPQADRRRQGCGPWRHSQSAAAPGLGPGANRCIPKLPWRFWVSSWS